MRISDWSSDVCSSDLQVWTVAGVFHSGDAMDSEVWGDADVVANTYRRGSTRSSFTAKLENPGAFKQFKAALAADPRLDVDASTTLEYFSKQSEGMTKVIRIIGIRSEEHTSELQSLMRIS